MIPTEKLYQKVKDDYNSIADHFSQTRQWPWPEFSDFKTYLKKGQRVLDVGCGNGRLYFSFLKDLDLEYHGIDVSERLVGFAIRDSRFAIPTTPKPNFNIGEIINLAYEDDYFDLIFCIATFHHLPSKKLRLKALSEMKRVLKPGGYLLMTNWYWWEKFPWKYFFKKPFWKNSWKDLFIPWKNPQGEIMVQHYYYAFTKKELESLIKKTGLKVEKSWIKSDSQRTGKKSRANIVTIVQKP